MNRHGITIREKLEAETFLFQTNFPSKRVNTLNTDHQKRPGSKKPHNCKLFSQKAINAEKKQFCLQRATKL
jgi:hypothetical protein